MKVNVKLHKKSLNPEERIKRIKRLMNSDLDGNIQTHLEYAGADDSITCRFIPGRAYRRLREDRKGNLKTIYKDPFVILARIDDSYVAVKGMRKPVATCMKRSSDGLKYEYFEYKKGRYRYSAAACEENDPDLLVRPPIRLC